MVDVPSILFRPQKSSRLATAQPKRYSRGLEETWRNKQKEKTRFCVAPSAPPIPSSDRTAHCRQLSWAACPWSQGWSKDGREKKKWKGRLIFDDSFRLSIMVVMEAFNRNFKWSINLYILYLASLQIVQASPIPTQPTALHETSQNKDMFSGWDGDWGMCLYYNLIKC
jgi:hypothetical protein